jgi:hypothetical protein
LAGKDPEQRRSSRRPSRVNVGETARGVFKHADAGSFGDVFDVPSPRFGQPVGQSGQVGMA